MYTHVAFSIPLASAVAHRAAYMAMVQRATCSSFSDLFGFCQTLVVASTTLTVYSMFDKKFMHKGERKKRSELSRHIVVRATEFDSVFLSRSRDLL